MLRSIAICSLAVALAACGSGADQPAPAEPTTTTATSKEAMSPREAYQQACAGCHDQGINGAPKTGDPEAWADRSPVWEAVLIEHANMGFLGMPAGGVDGLSEAEIASAAEYMLGLTHPEAPPD